MTRALFLAVTLVASAAAAQDDDLPALPTAPKKPKAQPKARPRPQPKKPTPVDEDLPALPAQKGDVVVKLSSPLKGAKLTIDNNEVGQLPQPAQSLSPGEHTVSVRRLGFAPFAKRVNVVGGKTVDVNVTLEPQSAVLTVTSDVAGAQVFVNGRLTGTAPLVEVEVPPGNIEIAVKKDGYHDATQLIAAKPGRDYPVEVKLGAPISAGAVASDTPTRTDLTPTGPGAEHPVTTATATYESGTPIYKQWWFWTIAVVVVGGLVTGATLIGLKQDQVAHLPVPLKKSAWPCEMSGQPGCDSWINQPSAIVPLPH